MFFSNLSLRNTGLSFSSLCTGYADYDAMVTSNSVLPVLPAHLLIVFLQIAYRRLQTSDMYCAPGE
jgi:hypothetical protein